MKFSKSANNVKFDGKTKDSKEEYFTNKRKALIKNI